MHVKAIYKDKSPIKMYVLLKFNVTPLDNFPTGYLTLSLKEAARYTSFVHNFFKRIDINLSGISEVQPCLEAMELPSFRPPKLGSSGIPRKMDPVLNVRKPCSISEELLNNGQ